MQESHHPVFPGADENTPSRSEYFSWINHCNEGPTAEQTLANLDFFRYLHDRFGMVLDIYAWDAGAVDGKRFYGKVGSERFRRQFPEGFGPLAAAAARCGARLGLWGGPDGFGHTPGEREARIAQLEALCRDYHFALFKFDGVCGQLRPEYESAFIELMTRCRRYSPDLILLNHRLPLTAAGLAHATTFLWDGCESYIDVLMTNTMTAPHHRAQALARGLVPGLSRLAEDHGVCLSSCLDRWDDELVLQAFNRNLVVAPEIYGNPWLLRDDELPKLARIFNLHRRFRERIIPARVLDEAVYGPAAVSRGDGRLQLVTLRNLSWEPKTVPLKLSDLGLELERIELRRFHPREFCYGEFGADDTVMIELPSFRSVLLYAGEPCAEPKVEGAEFEVVCDLPGRPLELTVYTPLPTRLPWHRHLGTLSEIPIPDDAEALYEATVFAADNNALEVRSLERAGETAIPEVRRAREAFFGQRRFRAYNLWDRNLFNSDPELGFSPLRHTANPAWADCCFRLDLGAVTEVDELVLRAANEFELLPLDLQEGNDVWVSDDLRNWSRRTFISELESVIPVHAAIRYVKIPVAPQRLIEVSGTDRGGRALDRTHWRASNRFRPSFPVRKCFGLRLTLPEIAPKSKLCVALEGEHGCEGAYAALRIDGRPAGCPDRAPSYSSCHFEHRVEPVARNYTYYFPLSPELVGRELEVVVLAGDPEHLSFRPELWLTAEEAPATRRTLILER